MVFGISMGFLTTEPQSWCFREQQLLPALPAFTHCPSPTGRWEGRRRGRVWGKGRGTSRKALAKKTGKEAKEHQRPEHTWFPSFAGWIVSKSKAGPCRNPLPPPWEISHISTCLVSFPDPLYPTSRFSCSQDSFPEGQSSSLSSSTCLPLSGPSPLTQFPFLKEGSGPSEIVPSCASGHTHTRTHTHTHTHTPDPQNLHFFVETHTLYTLEIELPQHNLRASMLLGLRLWVSLNGKPARYCN